MSAPTPETATNSDSARASLEALRTEIGKAVVGQDPAVTGLVVALLCRGHVLLEGVPGVAKPRPPVCLGTDAFHTPPALLG
ncbi:hypothetical protein ACWCQ0_45420, partial [Streptomyces massasporeus]